MDPIKDIRKQISKKSGTQQNKKNKKVEFKLKINLWKVIMTTFIIIFFALDHKAPCLML